MAVARVDGRLRGIAAAGWIRSIHYDPTSWLCSICRYPARIRHGVHVDDRRMIDSGRRAASPHAIDAVFRSLAIK